MKLTAKRMKRDLKKIVSNGAAVPELYSLDRMA